MRPSLIIDDSVAHVASVCHDSDVPKNVQASQGDNVIRFLRMIGAKMDIYDHRCGGPFKTRNHYTKAL
jgi:hypothetical protein